MPAVIDDLALDNALTLILIVDRVAVLVVVVVAAVLIVVAVLALPRNLAGTLLAGLADPVRELD